MGECRRQFMKSCKILSEHVMSTTTSRTPMPHIHRNVNAFPEPGSGRNTDFP